MLSSNIKGVILWVDRIVAIAADCKSTDFGLRVGSNPTMCLLPFSLFGRTPDSDSGGAGSSPAGAVDCLLVYLV